MEKMCLKCVNTTNNPTITISENGLCNVCNNYANHFNEKTLKEEMEFLKKLIDDNTEINSISALSGGKDSTAMLCTAKELGFKPLAITFTIGYNILSDNLKQKMSRVCGNLGVPHEYVDAHQYVTNVDKECFKLTAELYDEEINENSAQKFKDIYFEGRRHYSTKDQTVMAFVRPCQICRKIAIRAYYEEAIKRNVRIVFVGMNEWTGLSNNSYSAIRELKPFPDKPSVFVVHLPYLIGRKINDLDEILDKVEWTREMGDSKADTGGNACWLARIAEVKATKILGFNVDESRLGREVTVGFLDKNTALNAMNRYDREVGKSMHEVLKESELI